MPTTRHHQQTEEAQELAPLRPLKELKGLSKVMKIQFIKENQIYEEAHLNEMTVQELDHVLEQWHLSQTQGDQTPMNQKSYLKKDAMACVPTLQKAVLLNILEDLGVRVEPKATNAALVLKIREEAQDL